MNIGNLGTRVITAAVAIPVLLVLIYWAPAWGFMLFILVAVGVAALELFGMTHPDDRVAQGLGVAFSCSASAALYYFHDDARALLTLVISLVILGLLSTLWRLGQVNTAALRLMAAVAAPLYLSLLSFLSLFRGTLGAEGSGYVVMTLMFAWMTDTGGYFAGRAFGRTKLYEAVSPKKTREGFAGGILGAVIAALLAHFWYLPTLPLLDSVLLAVACACVGQLGDLVESLMKRSTEIKDSGSIIPGHGGLLDRIDAVLFVAPVVYLYVLWRHAPI